MSNILAALNAWTEAQHGRSAESLAASNSRFRELLDTVRNCEQGGDIPTLSVKTNELIASLEKKVADINAAYDEAKGKLDVELATVGNHPAAVAAHFRDMAAAWENSGAYTVRYGNELGQKDGGPAVPVFPAAPRSESSIESAKAQLERDRASAIAPINVELDVLRLAADPAVDMKFATARSLLDAKVPTGLAY